MTTIQEIEMLTAMLRAIDGRVPLDADLLARLLVWRKQIANELRQAAARLDDATP